MMKCTYDGIIYLDNAQHVSHFTTSTWETNYVNLFLYATIDAIIIYVVICSITCYKYVFHTVSFLFEKNIRDTQVVINNKLAKMCSQSCNNLRRTQGKKKNQQSWRTKECDVVVIMRQC